MIKLTAENYPTSEYYKTDEMLTSLGIGEAAITALNEKGIPTPLAATLLRAPQSRMDILSDDEINEIVSNSRLVPKYNETIDRESAYEMLNKKIEVSQVPKTEPLPKFETPKRPGVVPKLKKVLSKKFLQVQLQNKSVERLQENLLVVF